MVINCEASNHIGCLVWCGIITIVWWLPIVKNVDDEVFGQATTKTNNHLRCISDGYQLWSKQPHRVLSMMWNNHLRCTYDDYQLWNVRCDQATTSGDVVTKVLKCWCDWPLGVRAWLHPLTESQWVRFGSTTPRTVANCLMRRLLHFSQRVCVDDDDDDQCCCEPWVRSWLHSLTE